jgi:arylformamidase
MRPDFLDDSWRSQSLELRQYEYSPSAWSAKPYAEYAPLFAAESEKEKKSLGDKLARLGYGLRQSNYLYWFSSTQKKPIFVWIHGGYWQGSSVDEALIGASRLAAAGYGFASVEYSLAPAVRVETMVKECIAAVERIRTLQPGTRIVLGGHSAGAHLALSVAQQIDVQGLVLVSGVFDLRPLVSTPINVALELDESSAEAVSPILKSFAVEPPKHAKIILGQGESKSFHDQSIAASDYLDSIGVRTELYEGPEMDHFSVISSQAHIDILLTGAWN